MKWVLYGAPVGIALLLWLLVKLDQNYKVIHHVVIVENSGSAHVVEMEAEGSGYALLFWQLPETLSLARWCMEEGRSPKGIFIRWKDIESRRRILCSQLQPRRYQPSIHWVLPQEADFVSPPKWKIDIIWVSANYQPPPWETEVVARLGKHLYPIALTLQWRVYPETLWVEAEIARYILATTSVKPRIEGANTERIELIPPQVRVQFLVPEPYADRWSPADFEVVVSMQKLLPGDTVVYPHLVRRPPFVRKIQIDPPALGFIRISYLQNER
ncbi:MAG: hypothetical protein NZ933_00025 [Bacteroidia bacterium]|nr:hypothetical protein [Bacteroidia bacterium]